MGSINDDVFIEDGTTAGLGIGSSGSATLQRNLEGERVGSHDGSSDDLVLGNKLIFAVHDDRGWQTGKHHALRHSYYIHVQTSSNGKLISIEWHMRTFPSNIFLFLPIAQASRVASTMIFILA